MAKASGKDEKIIIKKYANRRLYDTSTSSYVTLDHLSDLVRSGVDFEVLDAKSGEDLTRSVLTQIIFEQETKGNGALPTSFLRQLIRFYGDNMQAVLPAWLDMSMNSFAERQEKWNSTIGKAFPKSPIGVFEDQARRNMEVFEQAMSMFMPVTKRRKSSAPSSKETKGSKPTGKGASAAPSTEDPLSALQKQMAAMQAQLAELAKRDED